MQRYNSTPPDKKKYRTLTGLLRDLTGESFGIKTAVGVRSLPKVQFLDKKSFKPFPVKLSKVQYNQHFNNRETYYFYGSEKRYSLLMIDVDVGKANKQGTRDGAKQFSLTVQDSLGKVYFEPSTNGNGQHGYIIIDNNIDLPPEAVIKALKHLEQYLMALKEQSKADIELVEVKGTPHHGLKWEWDRYESRMVLKDLTYGSLAKIPRQATLKDLQNTRVITVEEILNLKLPEVQQIKKEKKVSGSVNRKAVDVENLINCRTLAAELWVKGPKRTNLRPLLIEDYAIALLILTHCSIDPNDDCTMPQARAKALWTALYDCGDINRAWSNDKWLTIRNHLSQVGWIEWMDQRYYPGVDGEKGKACQWELNEDVVERILNKYNKQQQPLFIDILQPITIKPVRVFRLALSDQQRYQFERRLIQHYKKRAA